MSVSYEKFGTNPPFLHVMSSECAPREDWYATYWSNILNINPGVFIIDSCACKTKKQLFDCLKKSLRFPDYFGYNWDALDECLADLEWLQKAGYVLVLSSANYLLDCEDTSEFYNLVTILNEVGHEYASYRDYGLQNTTPKPFHCVFQILESKKNSFLNKLSACLAEECFDMIN